MKGRMGLVVGGILLTGCGGPSVPEGPPLVVLATGEEGGLLAERLSEFTDETGIPVTVEWGTSSDNANRVIQKAGTPVDILMTDNVIDIWRAADEGALRPIQGAAFDGVAAQWKDPDKMWAATDVRPFLVIYPPGEATGATFLSLGDPALKGELCLTTSEMPQNRALMAYMIDDLGVRLAERVVRAWVRNTEWSPFTSQADLLDALQDGRCKFGIIASVSKPDGLLSFVPSEAAHYDIDAIGVGRHAQQPERAQQMVSWVLETNTWEAGAGTPMRNVGIAGPRDEEARLLAERAGYR